MKIFVLTYEANQYDQYGKYFICFFQHKPTYDQLYLSLNEYVSDYEDLDDEDEDECCYTHNDRHRVVKELMTNGVADTRFGYDTYYLQEVESNN